MVSTEGFPRGAHFSSAKIMLDAYHRDDLNVREGVGPDRPHQRITYRLQMEDVTKRLQTVVEVVDPKL